MSAMDVDDGEGGFTPFRLFTKETLENIDRCIAEEKAAKSADKAARDSDDEVGSVHDDLPQKPNTKLEAGKKIPPSLEDYFPHEYVGKPLEDVDDFYDNRKTFCVVARDKSIFRFSATNSLYIFSPFNPIRRCAIYILVHPVLVILTIMVNCVFMTMTKNKFEDTTEKTFTAIYTVESVVKICARGFLLHPFTYLRDPWNWLDFLVVSLAYITMGVELGNLSALRTFRVLRALKTVAVIPGLKTIVGALLEAVRRLRDVMILTSFVLSIFALVGMQLYKGALRQKCVVSMDNNNASNEVWDEHVHNVDNWFIKGNGEPLVCGNASGAGACPDNYTCIPELQSNPNHNYTSFDNFGWALLCAFRLMTQDFWENLYQLVLRAQGPFHAVYFILVILLGSFYLVNLILAIVAMSYDEQQKQDKADAEEELAERKQQQEDRKEAELQNEIHEIHEILSQQMTKSQSEFSCKSLPFYQGEKADDKERLSIQSEKQDLGQHLSVTDKRASFSLPGSPFVRRNSRSSWKKAKHGRHPDRQPLVPPYLENLNLPYADDSTAVTPCSDELCNLPIYRNLLNSRRSSFAAQTRRAYLDGYTSSRRSSFASQTSRTSRNSRLSPHSPLEQTKLSKLENLWNISKMKGHHLLPEVVIDRTKTEDNESSSGEDGEAAKKKDENNPFVCRTPSATNVDMRDVMVLKELIDHASGHRRSFMSDTSIEEELVKDKLFRIFCKWDFHPLFTKFKKMIGLFILDAFVDLFITLCILVNTSFMAMDRHGMSQEMTDIQKMGNIVFTIIFAAEAVLKILALSPNIYFREGWNVFDSIIVFLSLLEYALDGVSGLSVLRTFRLLRVFKLAKSWPTLNMLISIVARTMGALGNLTLVLGMVIFIFAVMGQQLFSVNYSYYNSPNHTYVANDELPRWNFVDFFHSFMIVFRVLCGEWIESMWGCMRVAGWPCIPFFLLTMIIGNLVVLNLFLALLLSSFGTESLQRSTTEEEPNKLAEAIDRFVRFGNWVKVNLIVCMKVKLRRKAKVPPALSPSATRLDMNGKDVVVDGQAVIGNGRVFDAQQSEETDQQIAPTKTADGITSDAVDGGQCPSRPVSQTSKKTIDGSDTGSTSSSSSTSNLSEDAAKERLRKVEIDGEPEINEVDIVYVKYPDDCFCKICKTKFPCCVKMENTKVGKVWWKIRCAAFAVVEHKYFETFIITMIAASSVALALEDYYLNERPGLQLALIIMDKCFTVIFIAEMLIKWLAFGFKVYFTDAWCWLDFVIVAISIVMLVAEGREMGNVGAFKTLRTLRALRPLRAVSRWEGMKVVVNALIKAIPSIFNVLLVCLVFWLIFGIVGVQLFAGKFYKCLDANGTKLDPNETANKSECLAKGHDWNNSDVNFDNVLNAYLALLQVATYKGWIDIMNDAIDNRDVGHQPKREANMYMYLYFVLFIVFGSFFTLNLFIGVIIDNFNQQKKKAGGSLEMFMTEDQKKYYKAMKRMSSKFPTKSIPRPAAGGSLELFMTDDQKKYYNAMKRMGDKSPTKSIPRPTWFPGGLCYDLTSLQKFDIGIMIIIILNMLTMTLEHHGQSDEFTNILYYINMAFIIIFTVECIIKLIGLRYFYFKIPWNVFDFVVVVLSILGLALADFLESLLVSPTLLRVVRVFRVGRVLRLVKSAKGIRTLLFSLAVSLPALFNIGLLLFLVLFIYAIFGMNFFMHVKLTAGMDDAFNFQTLPRSMILLFQMSTSAGWDGVLAALINEDDCNPKAKPSDCGSFPHAVIYLVTYLVISFLVVINMYIAVILENFSQATEDVQQGLTPDDFDMYYEKWEKFDPDATGYIDLDRLSDFVDYLEEPLRLTKPNHFVLVKLDIPICEGDHCNSKHILDALTKNFLGTADTGDIPDVSQEQKEKSDSYKQIGSTLLRQKEHYAARVLQKAFRNYQKRLDRSPPAYHTVVEMIEEQQDEDISKPNDLEVMIEEQKPVELRPDSDVVV